jgi:hypothetical protein
MRLPVVMTRISDIVPFVERFGSGVVIDGYSEIGEALDHIRMNYARYLEGVERFISNFEFETYYRNAFRAMEES